MKKILLILLVATVFFSCKEEEIPVPTALFFEQTNAVIEAKGETVSLEIKTTAPNLVTTMLSEAPWCSVKIENNKLVITAPANPSIASRETSVKVAAPDRHVIIPIKQNGQPTTKIKVESASASSFQDSEPIQLSFDGNITTNYHSNWGIKDATYTLIYNLASAASLDLISYYPRQVGTNGYFGEIEIWANTTTNSEYVKIMDYDCGGIEFVYKAPNALPPSHIELPVSVINPKSVKFVVLTGRGGFASCAEMEFYKKGE